MLSLSAPVSWAARRSTSALRAAASFSASARRFSSFFSLARSSSNSCLRLNTPTLRAVEPPVKEPPALMTCPSSVTMRLR